MKNLVPIIISVAVLTVIGLTIRTWYLWDANRTYAEVIPSVESLAVTATEIATSTSMIEELNCMFLDDFNGDSDLRWFTVNDGVMGGLSQGSATIAEGVLTHSGTINTNGGGFSYVGTRLPADVLVGYSRLQLRLNTGGRAYAVNFNDSRYWRINHQTPIPTSGESGWEEVVVNFSDTVPTVFSRRVDSEPFAADAVDELNFILSDGVDGPFAMQLDWVKVCR